jgi:hypothetical protein
MKKTILIAILSMFTFGGVFGQTITMNTISVTPTSVCVGDSVTLQFYATVTGGILSTGSYKVFYSPNSTGTPCTWLPNSIPATSWYYPVGTGTGPGTIKVVIPSSITSSLGFSSNGYLFVAQSSITPSLVTSRLPITILTPPSIPTISGLTILCLSSTITLTAHDSISGVTYKWNTGATTSFISVNSPSIYSVSAMNMCDTVISNSITVVNDSLPTINVSGPTIGCGSVLLNLNTTNSDSTYWYNGSLGTNITVTTSNTYYATAKNACGTVSDSITVTVNPLPTVTYFQVDSTVCASSTSLILNGNFPSGGTFSGTGVTGSMFDAAIAGVGTFPITYTVTDSNSCTNTATSNVVVSACTGITENNYSISNMYPIPANDILNIELANISNNNAKIVINIYSIDGKKVLSSQYDNSDKVAINVSDVKAGMYMVEVISDNLKTSKNIIISH